MPRCSRGILILLNLAMLHMFILYDKAVSGHKSYYVKDLVVHLCVGSAFILFIAIVCRHVYLQLKCLRQFLSSAVAKFRQRRDTCKKTMITAEENEERSSDDELIQARQFPPLVRYDYDREPLLVD